MSTVACPGQVIGSVTTHVPGPGTHVYESNIQASIAGPIFTRTATSKQGKPTISVGHDVADSGNTQAAGASLATLSSSPNKLPKVGSVVLGRVLRVQRLQLNISILMVDPATKTTDSDDALLYTTITNDELQPQAILRREDVRAYEKDKVIMNESFRTGDIMRAVVISLGDERNYYVSTAGNDYGVVVAKSVDGNALVPVSWKEMRDVVTGRGEMRKVAKPV